MGEVARAMAVTKKHHHHISLSLPSLPFFLPLLAMLVPSATPATGAMGARPGHRCHGRPVRVFTCTHMCVVHVRNSTCKCVRVYIHTYYVYVKFVCVCFAMCVCAYVYVRANTPPGKAYDRDIIWVPWATL